MDVEYGTFEYKVIELSVRYDIVIILFTVHNLIDRSQSSDTEFIVIMNLLYNKIKMVLYLLPCTCAIS